VKGVLQRFAGARQKNSELREFFLHERICRPTLSGIGSAENSGLDNAGFDNDGRAFTGTS